MILKGCNKLCHSSRVKLPFVRMSASWFLDSTCMIWTFGSRLILSNNQSRATRWVPDTCLIVGLLPLMIIFITASVSSKCTTVILSQRDVRSKELHSDPTLVDLGCDFWVLTPVSYVHAWVGFGILWVVPSTSLTKSHKSSAGTPSIRKPASNDMISDSVEL